MEKYLKDVLDTSGKGVPETSYYPVLRDLFDSIGTTLDPKVSCTLHPKSQGAGLPDMGLYTEDQNIVHGSTLASGVIPSRGIVEVKGTSEDVITTAHRITAVLLLERELDANYRKSKQGSRPL